MNIIQLLIRAPVVRVKMAVHVQRRATRPLPAPVLLALLEQLVTVV
jgi:hypothetical protein